MSTPRTSKKSPTKKKKTTAAKKAASSKAPARKAAKKAPKKAAAAKKAPAKKAGTKKAATKKVAKKAPAKATSKPATSKTAASKTAASKTAANKTATESKPSAEKKTTASTKAKSGTTAAAKPAAKKKLPKFLTDPDWLKGQREMLIAERGKYIHNAEALAAEAHSLMADRDPGDVQFDEESGEGDTLAVERDRDLALSAKAREKVDEIDAALGRLDAGSYGVCISGEGDIVPKERLEFIPEAAKCVQHQTSMF